MKKELSNAISSPIFEQIKHLDENGTEYWSARHLSKVLEYSEYRHFLPALERAKEACENSGQNREDHFEDILEMIQIGKGGQRLVESVKLSRYACYLIVQNADPSKEVVALGQTYFAVQTRLQEIRQMEEYSRLSSDAEKRLFLRNELSAFVASSRKRIVREAANPSIVLRETPRRGRRRCRRGSIDEIPTRSLLVTSCIRSVSATSFLVCAVTIQSRACAFRIS